MFGNIKSLAYHQPNEQDPYLVLPPDEDDDEEREELQILATDNMLMAAKVEDEVAHLEIYVYEDAADNLYVHHDIMLPAIPLAVEWLDLPVGKEAKKRGPNAAGNFVAVATMEPEIEIWDLDVVDSMYPNAILGQPTDESSTKKTKKNKKALKRANDAYHVDSVLALAANRSHRNLMASGSADKTIKLWDLTTCTAAKSYSYHTDKVCALAWHKTESTVLLSGSYDHTVVMADMRAADVASAASRWGVEADVETVKWDPHNANVFYVTTEAGTIHCHDARNAPSTPAASKPLWTLQAHDDAVSAFDVNPIIPGFFATGGSDKTVKLWSVTDNKPGMVVSRNLDVGRVFSTQFAPDAEVGFRLAVAGSNGNLQVWDTSTNAAVRRRFAALVPEVQGEVKERILKVNDEEDDSEDDEEDEEEMGDAGPDGWESMDED